MSNGRFGAPPVDAPPKPGSAPPAKVPLIPPPLRHEERVIDSQPEPGFLERLKRLMKSQEALSKAEAEGYRAKLIAAMPQIWQALDEGISLTTANKQEAVIWQTIDDEDNAFIVSLILRSGMASPVAALVVRQVVSKLELLRLGLITWPRFQASINHYAKNGGFALPWQLSLLARSG